MAEVAAATAAVSPQPLVVESAEEPAAASPPREDRAIRRRRARDAARKRAERAKPVSFRIEARGHRATRKLVKLVAKELNHAQESSEDE
jgi:hypothetical protein